MPEEFPPPDLSAIWTYKITLEDVSRVYPPLTELTKYEPKYEGPVLALGRAVYETQPQQATDAWGRLVERLARNFAPGNLWILPTYERLPYPYGIYWPLACAFKTERAQKRRFDWYLWMDDDVMLHPDGLLALAHAAMDNGYPFVAGVPYDRFPPHLPSVTEMHKDGNIWKWIKAPKTGTYPCFTVGLCAAVFHRSIFEMVPEPWFGAMPPIRGFSGVHPDWWWCYQMQAVGITPHVCCDCVPIHLGLKRQIERKWSEAWLEANIDHPEYPEIHPENRQESNTSGASISFPRKNFDGRDPEKLEMAKIHARELKDKRDDSGGDPDIRRDEGQAVPGDSEPSA